MAIHMKKRYAALALCLALALPLSSCGEKKDKLLLPKPENCAYAAGVYVDEENTINVNQAALNTYGNRPYSATAANRRAVQVGDVLYSAVNAKQALQKIDAKGRATTLYDKVKVGQVSFYAGYVYFSDYVAVTEPRVQGVFYSRRLYRLDMSSGKKEPELLYEGKIKEEYFASFQLCNGALYLMGTQAFETFGVKRLGMDGKAMADTGATLLGDPNITAAQVSGGNVYYLLRGELHQASLRGVERTKLLEDNDVRAFCAVENTLYFTRLNAPGVYALNLETRAVSLFRAKGDVEAFFSLSGDGAPDCFVIKPVGVDDKGKRELIHQPAKGEAKTLVEDVMPLDLNFMQPFCEGGKIYYFSCDTTVFPAQGYIRAIDPVTGKAETCYDWAITKGEAAK